MYKTRQVGQTDYRSMQSRDCQRVLGLWRLWAQNAISKIALLNLNVLEDPSIGYCPHLWLSKVIDWGTNTTLINCFHLSEYQKALHWVQWQGTHLSTIPEWFYRPRSLAKQGNNALGRVCPSIFPTSRCWIFLTSLLPCRKVNGRGQGQRSGQGHGSRSNFWRTAVNIRGAAWPSHYQSKLFVRVSTNRVDWLLRWSALISDLWPQPSGPIRDFWAWSKPIVWLTCYNAHFPNGGRSP